MRWDLMLWISNAMEDVEVLLEMIWWPLELREDPQSRVICCTCSTAEGFYVDKVCLGSNTLYMCNLACQPAVIVCRW
jgi:hypothetical protein